MENTRDVNMVDTPQEAEHEDDGPILPLRGTVAGRLIQQRKAEMRQRRAQRKKDIEESTYIPRGVTRLRGRAQIKREYGRDGQVTGVRAHDRPEVLRTTTYQSGRVEADVTPRNAHQMVDAYVDAEGLDPDTDLVHISINRVGGQRMEKGLSLDEAENAIQGQSRLPEVGRILPIDMDSSESQAGGSQAGSSVATRGFPRGQEGQGGGRGRGGRGGGRSGSSLGDYHQGGSRGGRRGRGGGTAVTPHLDEPLTDTKGRRSYRQEDEEDELAELDRQMEEYMLTDEGIDKVSTSLEANPLDDSPPGDDEMDCAGN